MAYDSGGDRSCQGIAGHTGRMASMTVSTVTLATLTVSTLTLATLTPDAALDPVALARIITAIVFVGIGITHFVPAVVRGMAAMVPRVFHGRPFSARGWVWVTGVAEIAGGFGLLWEPTRAAAGIALAVFLVCVFPANAYAARHRDRFGVIAVPFWPRLVMQLVLIALVLWVGLS